MKCETKESIEEENRTTNNVCEYMENSSKQLQNTTINAFLTHLKPSQIYFCFTHTHHKKIYQCSHCTKMKHSTHTTLPKRFNLSSVPLLFFSCFVLVSTLMVVCAFVLATRVLAAFVPHHHQTRDKKQKL